MLYRLLAELLMILHFSWIIFMVAGFVLTVAGFWRTGLFDWWRFRTAHLLGIIFVAFMALIGEYCPLTDWEWALRRMADPTAQPSESFIVHWLEKIIYPDVPLWIILVPTYALALFTVMVFVIRPPSRFRRRQK